MKPDELAEYWRTATPEQRARMLHDNPWLTHYLPANTATPGGTPDTGVVRPPEAEIGAAPGTRPLPSKYRNQKAEYNGRMYDSKKEANYARDLDLRVKAGEVLSWIPQVSIPLPGGARHVIDFMIIWNPIRGNLAPGYHEVSFVEVKGRDLPMGRLKRQQVEELYEIKVLVELND